MNREPYLVISASMVLRLDVNNLTWSQQMDAKDGEQEIHDTGHDLNPAGRPKVCTGEEPVWTTQGRFEQTKIRFVPPQRFPLCGTDILSWDWKRRDQSEALRDHGGTKSTSPTSVTHPQV